METILHVVRSEFGDIPSGEELTRIILRLFLAGILAGLVGFEREARGKSAGLKTHIVLSIGTAFFVMVPLLLGMDEESLSRVLQGILTGIGFIGAGTILKHAEEHRIEGLTTSVGLWFAAAIGVSCGLGRLSTAVIGSIVVLAILLLVPHVSKFASKPETLIETDHSRPFGFRRRARKGG